MKWIVGWYTDVRHSACMLEKAVGGKREPRADFGVGNSSYCGRNMLLSLAKVKKI